APGETFDVSIAGGEARRGRRHGFVRLASRDGCLMEALLVSAGTEAIAEIGDKTQLLAILLIGRFQRPIPIIGGILVATIANHLAAAWVGVEVAAWLSPRNLAWILGISFLAMAGWALIPDKADDAAPKTTDAAGAFLTTVVAFFLVEMGDK